MNRKAGVCPIHLLMSHWTDSTHVVSGGRQDVPTRRHTHTNTQTHTHTHTHTLHTHTPHLRYTHTHYDIYINMYSTSISISFISILFSQYSIRSSALFPLISHTLSSILSAGLFGHTHTHTHIYTT